MSELTPERLDQIKRWLRQAQGPVAGHLAAGLWMTATSDLLAAYEAQAKALDLLSRGIEAQTQVINEARAQLQAQGKELAEAKNDLAEALDGIQSARAAADQGWEHAEKVEKQLAEARAIPDLREEAANLRYLDERHEEELAEARAEANDWKLQTEASIARWKPRAEAAEAALAEARRDFMYCCRYDALMEGPRFQAYNRSELDRLRERYEAECRAEDRKAIAAIGEGEQG